MTAGSASALGSAIALDPSNDASPQFGQVAHSAPTIELQRRQVFMVWAGP
jgi:hypothetical protein